MAQTPITKELIREFQRDIERVSIRKRDANYDDARRDIIRLLYVDPNGSDTAWEGRLLRHLGESDINTINIYVMDCLRAVITGHTRIGGIGYNPTLTEGCIQRGIGSNVRSNRDATPRLLPDYVSISRILSIRRNDFVYSCELINNLLHK